ncbi:MAG: RHS repeat-associated core domain-containing protein [Terriglobia bacterium]
MKPTRAIPAGAVLKREAVNTFAILRWTHRPIPIALLPALQSPIPQLKNAINLKDIKFNSSTVAKTEYSYDNYSTAGNLTQERRWDPQTLTWATTVNHSYDSYGNRTLTTNARGYQTTFGYGNVCGITGLYVTDITLASNATTDLQRKSHLDYDCNFGLVTTETDVDNGIIASTSYDVFGRPTLVVEAQGISGEQRQTTTTYDDQNRKITIRSDLKTYQDGSLVTETSYDPLGRVYLARRLESPSDSSGIKTDSRSIFSGTNSYRVVSNPYRTTSDLTAGWTRSKMDQSGRVLEVETFSGAAYPAPWGSNTNTTGKVVTNYNADVTTVTDQANKKRSSTKDGLGRLIKVTEDPSGTPLDTLYSYDVLDNLTSVTQVSQTPPATQTRTFLYNSLSQLTSATNPESGTISYTYDPNGNLLTKADARPKTITYTYDPLDRLSTKSYSDSTPAVTYGYGAPSPGTSCGTFSVGKVCSVSTSVAATNFSNYNSKGQATQSSQTINAITTTYPFSYTYGLSGRMTSQTYPSTVTVVNTVEDEAGRIAGVSNGDGSLYYAGASYSDLTNRIQYSPAGAMVQMRLGNGLWNDTRFNSRLQAIQIGLGQTRLTNLESTITPSSTVADKLLLDLCFSGTDTNCSNGVTTNNGNLSRQRLRKQSTPGLDLSQSYTYDALNRITSAGETPVTGTVWPAITYGLDRYGNRWVSAGYNPGGTLTPISQSEFNAANNRMVSPSGYDAVGNQTTNKVSQTATYDAESRMTSFNSGAGITNYAYDGEGRRVSKQLSSGATTYYVYNTLGQLSAEYLTTGPVGGGITYLTWDHLGSTRVTTDAAKAFKTCHDYLPYGEEIDPSYGGRAGFPCYTSTLLDGPNQKFTAKERDTESKLDYFLARYYSGAQGRFTSVDPENSGAVPDDPQSWNAYAYARNNPLYYIDPTGEAYNYCPSESDSCYEVADEDFKKFQEDNKGKLIFEGTNIYTVNEDGTKGSLYATYDYALPQGTAQVASQVVEHAGPAVNFFYTLTMAFLFNAGPGILADSYSMPQLATSIGRALIANGTKAGAREVIERTAMSQAQKAAAKRAVARATTRETISVDRLADGSLRIMKQRPGGDGYQVIQTIVRPDGGSSTVQMGVTAAGKLTHYDPK